MAHNHKKKKRAYLDDYHKNSEGRYEYRGNYFVLEGLNGGLSKMKRMLWCIYIPLIVCAVISGCLPAQGLTNTFYVILPYACGVIGAVTLGWALCRLCSNGNELKAYIYEATVLKFTSRAMVTIVFSLAAVLGEIVYIVSNGVSGQIPYFIAFGLLELAVCAFAACFYRLSKSFEWKLVPGKSKRTEDQALQPGAVACENDD